MSLIKQVRLFIGRICGEPEKINNTQENLGKIEQSQICKIQEALGRIEQRQIEHHSKDISEAEFRVYSQWGEDGIIQYLIKRVPMDRRIFIEFGVQNYTESNTRFLLVNNNWSGLILDGSKEHVDYIKTDSIYWKYNLKAECAFITRENINELIMGSGIKGDIGLLSVDIDGNDYWIWEAITCISPRIVVCEYNSLFGVSAKVSTPYHPEFVRSKAHSSMVYYGASIAALCELAGHKGYSLITSNSAGNNLFFVRNDLLGGLNVKSPAEVYQKAQFRESRDEKGCLAFYDYETSQKMIADLGIYDFSTKSIKKINDVAGIIS